MEIFKTISIKLSKSSAKLIDNNVINTLAWMITTNQKQIQELVDDVIDKLDEDARYDGSSDHTDKLKRIGWLDANIEEQLSAFEEAKVYYTETYGEVWKPKAASNVTSTSAVVSKYFTKKAAA